MEQVAHQAVVMQFILEMASNSQQDPRGCFRQFFHKAKVRQINVLLTLNVLLLPVYISVALILTMQGCAEGSFPHTVTPVAL